MGSNFCGCNNDPGPGNESNVFNNKNKLFF